jgi:hypothetical protein
MEITLLLFKLDENPTDFVSFPVQVKPKITSLL